MSTCSKCKCYFQEPPGEEGDHGCPKCGEEFYLGEKEMDIEREIECLKAMEQERDRDLNQLEDRIIELEKTLKEEQDEDNQSG